MGNISDAIRLVTATPSLKVDQALEAFKTLSFDCKTSAGKAVKEVKVAVSSLDSTVDNIAKLEAAITTREADSTARLEATATSLAASAADISGQLQQFAVDKTTWATALEDATKKLSGVADGLLAHQQSACNREAALATQETAAAERAVQLELTLQRFQSAVTGVPLNPTSEDSPIRYFAYPAARTSDSPATFFGVLSAGGTPPVRSADSSGASHPQVTVTALAQPTPAADAAAAPPVDEEVAAPVATAQVTAPASAAAVEESPATGDAVSPAVVVPAAKVPPAKPAKVKRKSNEGDDVPPAAKHKGRKSRDDADGQPPPKTLKKTKKKEVVAAPPSATSSGSSAKAPLIKKRKLPASAAGPSKQPSFSDTFAAGMKVSGLGRAVSSDDYVDEDGDDVLVESPPDSGDDDDQADVRNDEDDSNDDGGTKYKRHKSTVFKNAKVTLTGSSLRTALTVHTLPSFRSPCRIRRGCRRTVRTLAAARPLHPLW